MKNLFIFTIIFIFIFSINLLGQSKNSIDENFVQEFMRRQRAEDDAESRKDYLALERIFAEDFRFIAANGADYDKKKFLDEMKADTEVGAPQKLVYEDFNVRAYGKIAVVNYLLIVSGKDSGGKDYANRYRISVLWIKQKKDWLITNYHSTRVRQ